MLNFLLHRPIAVCLSFTAMVLLGVISYFNIPLSLMPEVDVPKLRVEITYPQGSPIFIEQSILQPLRLKFQGLYQVDDTESIAASGTGQIELSFAYGTNMKMAYIEANEKLDQTLVSLPRDLVRPIIKRIESTDIPIARLQVTSDIEDILLLSDLSEFVLKRRLEQLDGVSLVEMNGQVNHVIRIIPDLKTLQSLGIDESAIINTISASNTSLSQLKVKEGIYEYDITFDNLLDNPDNLKNLKIISQNGEMIPLINVAKVEESIAKEAGLHLFNGKRGIVFAIHKQADANFNDLNVELMDLMGEIKKDYPSINFDITQNQAELLHDSIYRLVISIALGAVLSFLILFLFSGEWRSPMIMGVLIPSSLVITLLFMYTFGLSLNIVSLSGLLLGIGILIDNAIIIIDNIGIKRKEGKSIMEACHEGVTEIQVALFSSTLTTLSVFVPLVFLGGLAGTLFQAQAITIAIILLCSLLVSIVLLPVLYRIISPDVNKDENLLYKNLLQLYKKGQSAVYDKVFIGIFLLLIVSGIYVLLQLEKQNLPEIKTSDASIHIQWDDPITLEENNRRIYQLLNGEEMVDLYEVDQGKNEIVEKGINVIQQSLIYIDTKSHENKNAATGKITTQVRSLFPKAIVTTSRAKNPYDQLFDPEEPYAVFKIRTTNNSLITSDELIKYNIKGNIGHGFLSQNGLGITFDKTRLYTYGLTEDQIIGKLKIHFNDQQITTVNKVNYAVPIVIRGNQKLIKSALNELFIKVNDSTKYPITYFFNFRDEITNKFITADKAGIYQDVKIDNVTYFASLSKSLKKFREEKGLVISISGLFLQSKETLIKLVVSLALAVVLLYVILAAQFESFRFPIIILAEIPVSASGSLLALFLLGHTLNTSSLIGIVIMLGIIVNDSILKVDTINRYRKGGMRLNDAIKLAGINRLKPILMTSLTTILALIPILFGTGIGSDLQAPLAISVIGGLFVGTICSIYLVPILYRRLVRKAAIV